MERRNLLVATETLSGAPITRLSTGTLAHPAPRPNMPAITPMATNSTRPWAVRWIFQLTSWPVEGSW